MRKAADAARAPPIPDDSAPPTRDELERKAAELGIKIDGRWGDARLASEIELAPLYVWSELRAAIKANVNNGNVPPGKTSDVLAALIRRNPTLGGVVMANKGDEWFYLEWLAKKHGRTADIIRLRPRLAAAAGPQRVVGVLGEHQVVGAKASADVGDLLRLRIEEVFLAAIEHHARRRGHLVGEGPSFAWGLHGACVFSGAAHYRVMISSPNVRGLTLPRFAR